MQKIRIVAPMGATFPAGTVLGGLSKDQIARRVLRLEEVENAAGLHRATAPVSFKLGEELAVAGDVPKAVAEAVEDAAKPAKSKAAPNVPATKQPAKKATKQPAKKTPAPDASKEDDSDTASNDNTNADTGSDGADGGGDPDLDPTA